MSADSVIAVYHCQISWAGMKNKAGQSVQDISFGEERKLVIAQIVLEHESWAMVPMEDAKTHIQVGASTWKTQRSVMAVDKSFSFIFRLSPSPSYFPSLSYHSHTSYSHFPSPILQTQKKIYSLGWGTQVEEVVKAEWSPTARSHKESDQSRQGIHPALIASSNSSSTANDSCTTTDLWGSNNG